MGVKVFQIEERDLLFFFKHATESPLKLNAVSSETACIYFHEVGVE